MQFHWMAREPLECTDSIVVFLCHCWATCLGKQHLIEYSISCHRMTVITWSFDFYDALYSLATDFSLFHFSKMCYVFWYMLFVCRSRKGRLRQDNNIIGRLTSKQCKKKKKIEWEQSVN